MKNVVIDDSFSFPSRSPEEIAARRAKILADPASLALARAAKRWLKQKGTESGANEIDTSWIPDTDTAEADALTGKV